MAKDAMRKSAWAITYGFTMPRCHPFVGQHYFQRANRLSLAPHGTLNVALFPTRDDAVRAHALVKRKNPKAKIVRVTVDLEWDKKYSHSEKQPR
jgi:hypothetical protein